MATADDQDRAEDFAALAELAEAFTSLVAALQQQQPQLVPERIVQVAATCMPRSQHAALVIASHNTDTGTDTDIGTNTDSGTGVSSGFSSGVSTGVSSGLQTVADTGDLAATIDRIRVDTGEGPALDVMDTNDLVVTGDLTSDPRWPRFGPQVTAATGIRSIATYRLYLSPAHRAALSFYSDWPYAFDELATATGAIFAAYCSLTLSYDLLLDEPVGPRRAVDVHREIGVAIGILMATTHHTTQSAYRALHGASRALQRSLPDLAGHVIAHRQLPDRSTGERDGR